MSLKDLQGGIASDNDVLCALSLLVWDSRTMMPAGSTETRGEQSATLTGIARDLLLSDATARALNKAQAAAMNPPEDAPERRAVEQTAASVAFHRRIPADLLQRKTIQRVVASAAWIVARERSDFSLFEPHLKVRLELAAGDYTPLREWLTEHVCRHGRRFSRQELLVRATRRPLTVQPYLNYLSRKRGASPSPSAWNRSA